MKKTVKRICIVTFIGISVLGLFYIFVGQEYVYAKKHANRLLEYKVPEKTKVIEQSFEYGIFYGGGPTGSGGYPTVAAYQKLSTGLSEKEIYNHYNKNSLEIYFEGTEELKKNRNNQVWYEGTLKREDDLSSKENDEEPIEVIIQYRTEFSYPFFIDFN